MATAPPDRPCKPRAPTLRPRALTLFGRDTGGATALEFSLVALPFLALLGGTLETALSFWAQSNLEQAVYEGSRDIYTGRFQTANASTKNTSQLIAALRTRICTEDNKPRVTLFDCANLRINVTVSSDFSALTPTSTTQTDAQTGERSWNPAFGAGYSCAGSSAAVLVEAAVDYPVYFTLLNPAAAVLPGSKRILRAASVFRVEPYDSNAACS